MPNDTFASLSRLSDAELVTRVKDLAARERGATALLVAHLAELDTRDVFLREGYGSLFAYCREALGLSEHEACNRIEAARAARRFPVILEMLAAGAVHLTAVRLLAPRLTPDNHRSALEAARGKRTEEVKEIAARLSPRPDVPPSIRKQRGFLEFHHVQPYAAGGPPTVENIQLRPSHSVRGKAVLRPGRIQRGWVRAGGERAVGRCAVDGHGELVLKRVGPRVPPSLQL